MGFKYRKSVKIAPGVRVNFGKKSSSVSFGTKGFKTTYSTSGRKTTSMGIPGTGLSYSTSSSTKKKESPKPTAGIQSCSSEPAEPKYSATTYKVCGIISLVFSIPVLLLSLLAAIVEPASLVVSAIAAVMLALGILWIRGAKQIKKDEPKRLARNAELLEWQNAILEDPIDSLIMSASQLEEATAQAVTNDIRIFDDCSNILNNTTNPTVYFPRLALAEETLIHLCSLERFMEKTRRITMHQKPSELYNMFLDNKERYVCDFIYKYYQTVKDKADTLKTERGKQNQYQKFYDSLQPYFDQISEKNKGYIEAMYQRKI